GDQIVGRTRPPGAASVWPGMALGLPFSHQRVHDLPGALALLAAGEDRVPSGNDLAEHIHIGVRQLLTRQALVLQLHARRHHLETAPWPLGSDSQQDALVRLEANYKE